MLRVCVFTLVCFTAVTASYLVWEDVISEEATRKGRFKRQTPEADSTTDGNKPPPGPPHHKFQCCKNMPMIISWDVMKKCMGPGGPRHGPPGPPPPGGDGGPPPPPPGGDGGPPPPPPEYDVDEADEGTENVDPTANTPESPEKYEEGGKGKGHRGGYGRGPGGHGRGRFKEHFACSMECAFGKINAIKDGAVDQAAFEDHISKQFGDNPDDPWKNVAVDAAKTCSSTDTAPADQEQKCKSGAAEVMKCMHKQMFKNCPEANWQNTEECNACRDSEEKCPFKKGGKWKGKGKGKGKKE